MQQRNEKMIGKIKKLCRSKLFSKKDKLKLANEVKKDAHHVLYRKEAMTKASRKNIVLIVL